VTDEASAVAGAAADIATDDATAAIEAIATAVPAQIPVSGSSGSLRARVEAVNIRASEHSGGLNSQSAGYEAAATPRTPDEIPRPPVSEEESDEKSRVWIGSFLDIINVVLILLVLVLITVQLLKILDDTMFEELQPRYHPHWKVPAWQPPDKRPK
jgi:hypothetical protein